MIIADGQRVRWDARTRLRVGSFGSIAAAPLGSEVNVAGRRQDDGSILAIQIEVKPNGIAMFEREVAGAFDRVEALWLHEGVMSFSDGKSVLKAGEIVSDGPDVERLRRILVRLLPPYVR